MAGPFYLAYVDEGTAFNAAVHNVMNEEVYSFTLEHSEGDFAALELVFKNPRIGLLNATRKQWIWFSFDKAWVPGAHVADIVPLFYGRLVAVPNDIQNEQLTVSFIARPADYQDQKETVAAGYRAAGGPYWDPIWFDPEKRDEPDNVLESRPELWHVNRTTHVVTTSHIINGEDGTITVDADTGFYAGMSVQYGEVPLKTVRMTADVNWDMAGATGVLDISSQFEFGGPGIIYTYTGKGLVDRWPKIGASLGNGWHVEDSLIGRIDNMGENVYYTNSGLFPSTQDYPFSYRPPGGPLVAFPHRYEHAVKVFVPAYLKDWITQGTERIAVILAVMRWRMLPMLRVRYDATRKYGETVIMELSADVQPIVTDAGGADVLDIKLSSGELATPIDPGGALPIRDVRRRSFFTTDRGKQALEYLIALMRSRLLARARTVIIEFPVPFMFGINSALSCRKNAVLEDPRLPGGTVGGKIMNYKLELDGESGEANCLITIGCTVGNGNTVEAVAGDPLYVNAGYVNAGYQQVENEFVMPFAGEVLYRSINGLPPNDDGVDILSFDSGNVVKSMLKENTWQEQETALATDERGDETFLCDTTPSDVLKRLETVPTRFTYVMQPVTGGPFATIYTVELSDLMVPKTIDLGAASA